jgi:anti-anti-sigma factor
MEIKVSTENGRVPITVVHIDGNIDSATYQVFQTRAEELIKGGTRHMLLDLSHSPYMSSAGLRALQTIFNQLRSLDPGADLDDHAVKQGISAGTYKSPHLKLLNLSGDAAVAFKTAGFDMFIENFTDLKTAIASF